MADRPLEIRARLRDQMSSTLRRMQQSVRQFVSGAVGQFAMLAKRLLSVRGLLTGIASAGAFTYLSKRVADSGVDLDTWSQKLGVSVEKLSALQFAAETSGFSFDMLREGLKSLQERMDDARSGNASYADQFAKIGIQVSDQAGKLRNIVDVLPELSAAYQRVARGGAQDLVWMTEDIVGGGENLLSVWLMQGPEAIAEGMRRAEEIGAILTRNFTFAANRFAKVWSETAGVVRGVVADLFTQIEPYLTAGLELVQEFLTRFRLDPDGFGKSVREAIGKAAVWLVEFLGSVVAGAQRMVANVLESIETVVNAFLVGMLKIQQAVIAVEIAIRKTLGEDMTYYAAATEERLAALSERFDAGSATVRRSADATEFFARSIGSLIGRVAIAIPWLDEYLGRVARLRGDGPAGESAAPEGGPAQTQLQNFLTGFGGQMSQMQEQWKDFTTQGIESARSFGGALQTNLAGSIESFLDGTRSAGQAFKDFGKLMIRSLIQMVAQFASLVILATAFNALTGGGFAGFGSFFGFGAAAANGASFGRGGVKRFADGGVVDRPTPFTYSGGRRIGVMGEAGPEAILPLRRGPGGRLGVEAASAGGGVQLVANVTFSGGAEQRGKQEDMARRIESVMLSLAETPRIRKAYRAGRYS